MARILMYPFMLGFLALLLGHSAVTLALPFLPDTHPVLVEVDEDVPVFVDPPVQFRSVHKSVNHTSHTRRGFDINFSCYYRESSGRSFGLRSGGQIMNQAVKVYLIWIGDWSAAERQVLEYFVSYFSQHAWFNTVSSGHYGSNNRYAPDTVTLGGSYLFSSYPINEYADIGKLIIKASQAYKFPIDANSVYLLIPSANANASPAVRNGACGWHSLASLQFKGHTVMAKYGMIFDDPVACTVSQIFPQGQETGRGQAIASITAHEVVEAITDPAPYSSWANPYTNEENADMCIYCYDTYSTTQSGALYNVLIGPDNLPYLIQQNYDPRYGKCVTTSLPNTNTVTCGTTTTNVACTSTCSISNAVCVRGVCQCKPNYCFVWGECRKFPAPRQFCRRPKIQPGVVLSPDQPKYPIHSTVTIGCNGNKQPKISVLTCMRNGYWDNSAVCL